MSKNIFLPLEERLARVNRVFFGIAMVIAFLMPIPVFFDVLLRSTIGASIFGIIEVEEIALLFLVYFGLAYLQSQDDHIRIELIDTMVSKDTVECLDFFTALLSFAFFAFIAVATVINISTKASEVSLVFGIPMPWLIVITSIGLAFLALTFFVQILRTFVDLIQKRLWLGLILAIAAAAVIIAIPYWVKAFGLMPRRFPLGLMGMGLMLSLLFLRMPLAFAMGFVGALGLLLLSPKPFMVAAMLGYTPFSSTASYTLTVVPLFILMGALCFRSGISNDLFNSAYTWLGRLPGGLAISSVAGCAGFAAVCGDSMATAVTMGTVALPEMRKKNYAPGLACGSLAAGGTLGILIPPSIGFIFYAIMTEESVGKLFAAGVVPGIVLTALFSIQIMIQAKLHPEKAPRGEATTFAQKIASLRGVIFMLLLFMLILGGIFFGWFSPTEGGAMGAAGAFFIALFRGCISKKTILDSLEETARFSSKLLVILFGVGILGNFFALTRMPHMLAKTIIGWNMSPYMFLLALVILFLILGCVMNVIPMLLLTLPSLYPTVQQMGFDPIWFGVVTVLVMEMGQITPPVGVNVFAISSVAQDVPLSTIFRGVMPFVLTMLFMVLLLVIFPEMALWLPGLLFK